MNDFRHFYAFHSCFHLFLIVCHGNKFLFSSRQLNFQTRLREFLCNTSISAAAYAPDPTPCLMQHNAFMVYRIAVPCDYLKDECWSFVAIRDGWIIVSFRGTRTKVQLIAELIETMSEPKKKVPSSLSNYFLFQCFYMINLHLKIYPRYQVLFTGHSLGGALASLASIVFAHRHPALQYMLFLRINLVTFGQPRVGNYEYAEAHSRLVPNSWRIVHKYDLVAHLPACAFRFFSHSCTPLLNHSPYHHGTEVWFPMNMTNNSIFRICEGTPQFEDDKCSNGYYLHYGVKDHLRYFEHDVSKYGSNGCVDVTDLD
ncbi:unnamed protein product [Angiostrongylus costaricensis]|uniref:Lipase_3 domain-containing protein n=1 Tax=Angiostrongylus costaricensis TaxID=334426 RepID=A0A0R3PE13_ANGCS|nr:unnamed protein product [Angiostrongylus costaricensis]